MKAEHYISTAVVCIFVSIAVEASVLAGIIRIEQGGYYFTWHIVLMGILILAQILMHLGQGRGTWSGKCSLLFAVAMSFTAVGDYVNSGMSSVEPLSNKLTMAVFLFGTGYVGYNYLLFMCPRDLSRKLSLKIVLLSALPILITNLVFWFVFVENNLKPFPFLHHSAFVFNLTIYAAMPLFALRYYHSTGWGPSGLAVILAGVLIPYSDLVLFGSWFKGGQNPLVAGIDLYAANWLVYYSGQGLMSMLPAFVALKESEGVQGKHGRSNGVLTE